MADASGWQIAGPYIAAGAALAWNAWSTFHGRTTQAVSVQWAVLSYTTDTAQVTLTNCGTAELYDVEATFQNGTTVRDRLESGGTIEWPTRAQLFDGQAPQWEVRATWRRRPSGRRQRARAGFIPTDPAEPMILQPVARARKLRQRLSVAISPDR